MAVDDINAEDLALKGNTRKYRAGEDVEWLITLHRDRILKRINCLIWSIKVLSKICQLVSKWIKISSFCL